MRFDRLRLAIKLWSAMGLMVVLLACIKAFATYQSRLSVKALMLRTRSCWPRSRPPTNGQQRWR